MKIDGGCHCGAITFEAEVDPETVAICHCTDCQTLSGTAFRTVVMVPEENLRVFTGEPTYYVKTGENGNRRAQTFCPTCGTPFYSTDAGSERPKIYAIRLGMVHQRENLPPKRQIWHRSAQGWLNGMSDLPTIETQ